MALESSPLPTIDVLPPLSARARDLFYGVLSWAAGIITIITTVYGVNPDAGIPTWLVTVNTVVVGLWTLLGFKAKANVSGAADVKGKHEA